MVSLDLTYVKRNERINASKWDYNNFAYKDIV